MQTLPITAMIAAAVLLTACASSSTTTSTSTSSNTTSFNQQALSAALQVPAGHQVAMETVGAGDITYQCKLKKDSADQFEWTFIGPDARLTDRSGRSAGKYFGPPATWQSNDGSKVTATQVAVAPAGAGNIPSQLVKANPAMGNGAMLGVSYIQRVATRGGVASADPCGASNAGARQTVKYQADYIFWKAV